MRRLELACETQIMAQSGGVKLRMPPQNVVQKTAGQTTQTVDKGADVDGPAMVWAAVRRWMEQMGSKAGLFLKSRLRVMTGGPKYSV